MRYCLALDLKNDPSLIQEYKQHHKNVWPEILESIRSSGIINMEIYNVHTRLFMILEVDKNFTFEKKKQLDASDKKVQDWESLMDKYQEKLPFAKSEEKWVLMEKIFDL